MGASPSCNGNDIGNGIGWMTDSNGTGNGNGNEWLPVQTVITRSEVHDDDNQS